MAEDASAACGRCGRYDTLRSIDACAFRIPGSSGLAGKSLSQRALWLTAAGIAGLSIATPLVSTRIFDKWFSFPQFLLLSQIPAISIALILTCHNRLRKLSKGIDGRQWVPFALAVAIFVLAFAGLAYSLFPYLVIDEMTIWDAASATNSMQFVLWGVLITLPAILGYTIFAYRVFWGKTRDLSYD
ncbi:MAG: cytochrome d ubiquinol oxidase subunit II [Woeseia sp.]